MIAACPLRHWLAQCCLNRFKGEQNGYQGFEFSFDVLICVERGRGKAGQWTKQCGYVIIRADDLSKS